MYTTAKFGCASCCLLCFTIMIIYSCENGKGRKLARVGDNYLYSADLNGLIRPNANATDSERFAKNYIRNWVEKQVLLLEADNTLTDEEKNKDIQIADYKNSLMIESLRQKIVQKHADTSVTTAEIREYYMKNRKEFELKTNLIRLNYFKFKKGITGIDKARQWFLTDDVNQTAKLMDYSKVLAEFSFVNDTVWLKFDDIAKEIPLKAYNEEQFLTNNRKTILEDALFLYFVDIKDSRIRSGVSPLELELDNIRNIIGNKKKIDAVKKKEIELLRNAEKEGITEIYKTP
ncbi:MAG: hypothetical protein SGJ10_00725 [Bacteroidota bacterium]|nr:hypothetical protein [Bacteroidota bacterium]